MSCVSLKNAAQPTRATPGSAGHDLSSTEDCTIPPGDRRLVSTGLRVLCPDGTYGRIAPRSGLASKHCIDVGAGVIDADYRGEVKVLLINNGKDEFSVTQGMRIAQLIFEKCWVADQLGLKMIFDDGNDASSKTERGSGGFGSTGI